MRWLLVVAATLPAAACVKLDRSAPKDMPPYVHIYPGGQPTMSMKLGGFASEVFTTSASPGQVMAYYRAEAAAAGLPESAAKGRPKPGQLKAAFGDPSGRMLVVVARPEKQPPGAIVALTYKPVKAAA